MFNDRPFQMVIYVLILFEVVVYQDHVAESLRAWHLCTRQLSHDTGKGQEK